MDALLKPENRGQLVEILKNHVIAGRVTLAKALEVRDAPTLLQGSKISFRFEDGRVVVGNASLLKADIAASNGLIHAIDQVLLPTTSPSKPLNPSQLIELAIERGVPVFNDGNAAECAALYEITVEALRGMDGVPDTSREMLGQAIMSSHAESSPSKRAWILRDAIDRTWASLNGAR